MDLPVVEMEKQGAVRLEDPAGLNDARFDKTGKIVEAVIKTL